MKMAGQGSEPNSANVVYRLVRGYTHLNGLVEYLGASKLAGLIGRSLKYAFSSRICSPAMQNQSGAAPLVSVIIATYNWSSVLRYAVRSVLWQTEPDFELLVVGDGCTDNSAAVVRSFADPRIRWYNLESNSGHQSAPNNAGLALARGRYIAYQGHDDIWHPEHLKTLLRVIQSARADFASSLAEMMGPPGSNFRVVTGIYPRKGYDGKHGLTIAGVMHRREVLSVLEKWKDYREVWRNPDVDFEYRAMEAGFKFVSTRELTVYKFNSSLRKDSYIHKPSHEQAEYCKRIEEQRWFMLREALAISRVHLLRPPMQVLTVPPPPGSRAPGWNVAHYRKYRGLE
jgi:glycosyltransferase involved in cell wall biosynthesis